MQYFRGSVKGTNGLRRDVGKFWYRKVILIDLGTVLRRVRGGRDEVWQRREGMQRADEVLSFQI